MKWIWGVLVLVFLWLASLVKVSYGAKEREALKQDAKDKRVYENFIHTRRGASIDSLRDKLKSGNF